MGNRAVIARDLIGAALDWAVAKCEGYTDFHRIDNRLDNEPHFAMHAPRREYGIVEMWELGFSTDWAQGGPIIERNEISVKRRAPCMRGEEWEAMGSITAKGAGYQYAVGPTPLIAAMRCYVASKLGDVVEVPDELMGE